MTKSEREVIESKEPKRPLEFQARYKITNLFTEFADEFTKRSHNSGVELHWIGVGTWKTPIELVPDKHLEAWKLSQDNAKQESKGALGKVEAEAIIHKYQTLIRAVPIGVYDEIFSSTKYAKKSAKKSEQKLSSIQASAKDKILSEEEREEIAVANFVVKAISDTTASPSTYELSDADTQAAMRTILQEYRKQLLEAVEFMKVKNEAVPQKIEDAIKHIDNQTVHWAGKR